MIELKRPLVFFDLETTGIMPSRDRIVEIAVVRVRPDGTETKWSSRINPEIPIPKEAQAVHGISDEDVKDCPTFKEIAPKLLELMDNADLAGYNSTQFDIPMLVEEFTRAQIIFPLQGRAFLDAMTIFRNKEPRTLTAAYKKYCQKDLEGAHGALADTEATKDVLFAQLSYYDDLPSSIADLGKYCMGTNADLAGRLGYDEDGEVVYRFGKYKNKRVKDIFLVDPSYMNWIMNSDFSILTKQKLEELFQEYQEERDAHSRR